MSNELSHSHPIDPVAHILAASGELIEALLWLRRNGPQKAAVAAWSARRCVLSVDPQFARGVSIRSALYRQQIAVEEATKGSCLRWDAEAIERATDLLRAVRPQAGPEPAAAADPAYRFELIGDIWHVRFGAEKGDFPKDRLKGMLMIAKLLGDPARPIPALRLEGGKGVRSSGPPPVEKIGRDSTADFQTSFSLPDVIDDEAKRNYLAEIRRIDAELEDSDTEPDERVQLQMQKEDIMNHLKTATRLGGGTRKLGATPDGRAVDRVRKALGAAYKAIAGAKMPALALHLETTVKRLESSSLYIYSPDPDTPAPDWRIEIP